MTGQEILKYAKSKYPNDKFHLNDKETLLGKYFPETSDIHPVAALTIIAGTWANVDPNYWPMVNGKHIVINWKWEL